MSDSTQKFLCFGLGNEEYAISISEVLRIIQNKEVSSIPNSSTEVLGVLNYRGKILSVYNFHDLLQLEYVGISEETCYLVLNTGFDEPNDICAIQIDRVLEVISIAQDDIKDTPSDIPAIEKEYLKGLVTINKKLRFIIDISKLFKEKHS